MPSASAPKNRIVRRPRTAAAAAQAPDTPQQEQPAVKIEDTPRQPARPTEHNGIPIVNEECRASPVNPKAFLKITKLHLSNDTIAFGCLDCLFTGDTRSELQRHRNAEHGTRFGKRRAKVRFATDDNLGDLVLPSRPDGTPAPIDVLEMTLAEFLSIMPSFAALMQYIEDIENRHQQLVDLVRQQKDELKASAYAVAVYPALQEEVIDLRLKIKGVGSFEANKAELLVLRDWKNKMTKRLATLGFVLNEEGE